MVLQACNDNLVRIDAADVSNGRPVLNEAPFGCRRSEVRDPEPRLATTRKQHVVIADLKILRENLLGVPGAIARPCPPARPLPAAIIDLCRRVDARRNVIGRDPTERFIRTNTQDAVASTHNAKEVG